MGAERGAGGAQEGRTEQEREELEKESISSPPASQAVDSETGKPDENLAKPKAEKRPTKEPDGFEEFWAAYPRRLAKGTARKAYAKAITKIEPTALLRAVKRQANAWTREGKEQQFIPHPATWLNGERWQDEAGKRRKPPDGDLRDVPLADWATDYA